MKVWRKYEGYLLIGEWHIHTSYTDGKNTVFEYCHMAEKLNVPLIAFTEHVRRKLTYDFNQFMDDIERARDEFNIIILSGCEAKVLPGGELDVERDILREVDYPILAFHSFPDDPELYVSSLINALRNPYVNAWAHPGKFLREKKLSLSKDELKEIFSVMKENDVLLEVNSRYHLPEKMWLELAKDIGVELVRGDDLHSVEDFERYCKFSISENKNNMHTK